MATKSESKRGRATEWDFHLGNRVRLQRELRGMSQSELGDFLDVSFQQIQKYEKGGNRISASRLYEIAHVLKVPITYFYEGLKPIVGEVAELPQLVGRQLEFAGYLPRLEEEAPQVFTALLQIVRHHVDDSDGAAE